MMSRLARGCCLALAVATLAGCYAAPGYKPAQNADEKRADDIMDALLGDDMRPVVSDFVPERKRDLLDPATVKKVHDQVRNAGNFLGAREVPTPKNHARTTRYFVASFSKGDVVVWMSQTDAGKIVHYHVGGALSQ